MASMRSIYSRFGAAICRRCINEQYGVDLKPKDCRYVGAYPDVCACCGKVRNLVGDVNLGGSLKLSVGARPSRLRGKHEVAV